MTPQEVLVSILKEISEEEKNIMEDWALGNFTGPSEYETIQMNSKALGVMEGLDMVKTIINNILEEIKERD